MTYTWNIGGTSSTTTANVKTSQALAASTTYTVQLRNTNGCIGNVSAPATITVHPLPAATVTAKTICSGGTVTLSATLGAGTTTSMTYTWNIGGTSSTTTANVKTSQALSANTTYTVQLRNTNGCTGNVSAPATITLYPAVSPGAITSASITTTAGINPDVTINGTAASGGSGSLTYEWRRTGTSTAILTGTGTAYNLSSDAIGNYGSAGIYRFNRYAKDTKCAHIAPVAATGTYTLYVSQPQGGCTYTEPAVVGTFASFPSTYSAATYVSLIDERDDRIYPVTKIGGRWIMARNLNYQTDLTWQANASSPSSVSVTGPNTDLIGHFWCPGGYGPSTTTSTRESCEVWGALYSWETAMSLDGYGTWTEVDTYHTGAANATNSNFNHGRTAHSGTGTGGRGICPLNWHVPTDYEWAIVLDGMESGGGSAHQNVSGSTFAGIDAGSRGKSKCMADEGSSSTQITDTQANWQYSAAADALGTDAYGFRALPVGLRSSLFFGNRGNNVYFWSSSARSDFDAWYHTFSSGSARTYRNAIARVYGNTVRCIRN
jgi:uncharacterized protein (TIGR02145 family)